jgi:tetratricopeptide (TPR) repeat protein
MKRFLILISIVAMALGIAAFQCSSTEITSAKLYIQQDNLPKAKEVLFKEIEKNPKSDEGYYLLGNVYAQQEKYDSMMVCFNKSLDISNKFKKEIERNKLTAWSKSFNKGVNYFNAASKAGNPDTTQMYFDKAINYFKLGTRLQPDSVATYKNLTYAYINSGQVEKALDPLNEWNDLKGSVKSYTLMGELYTSLGQKKMRTYETGGSPEDSVQAMEYYNKTVDLMKEAREKFPNNSDLLRFLSNAYIATGKMETAMNTFKEGIEQEPENKFYRYNYGVLLLQANRFEEAAGQFEKALEIDSNYTNALYNLAVNYVKWGAKLREDYEKASADEDLTEEQIKEFKSKYEKALPLLEKYLKEKPNNPDVWELLGKIYANLGMNEKSKNAFDQADQLRGN